MDALWVKLEDKIYKRLIEEWPGIFQENEMEKKRFFENFGLIFQSFFDFKNPNFEVFFGRLKEYLISYYHLPYNPSQEVLPSEVTVNDDWHLINLYQSNKAKAEEKKQKDLIKSEKKNLKEVLLNQINEKKLKSQIKDDEKEEFLIKNYKGDSKQINGVNYAQYTEWLEDKKNKENEEKQLDKKFCKEYSQLLEKQEAESQKAYMNIMSRSMKGYSSLDQPSLKQVYTENLKFLQSQMKHKSEEQTLTKIQSLEKSKTQIEQIKLEESTKQKEDKVRKERIKADIKKSLLEQIKLKSELRPLKMSEQEKLLNSKLLKEAKDYLKSSKL